VVPAAPAVRRAPPRPAGAVAVTAGALVTATGLVELYGWLSHTRGLLQLRTGQVPMQFNTALCLALLGAGLLLLPLRRRVWAALPAAYVAVWGTLTLAEYLSDRSFGVDELWFRSWIVTGVDAPGRMARSTALCFTLLGWAVLLVALRAVRLRAALVVGLAGSFVAGLTLVALFGYVSGVSTAYTWRTSTAMAPLTAGCLLILAIGYVTAAWYREEGAPRWLPVPVGVGALAVSLFLWQALLALGGREGRALSVDRAAGGVLAIGLVFSALLALATTLGQAAFRRRRTAEALARRLAEEGKARSSVQDVLLRRAQRDTVLKTAYAAVSVATDLAEAMDAFALAVSDAIAVDRISFATIDGDTSTVRAATGAAAGAAPVGTVTPNTDQVLATIVATRQPWIVNDTEAEHGQSYAASIGIRSFVVAPVVVAGQPRGLLSFSSSRANVFAEEHLALVEELTPLVGGALYTLARLNDEREATQRLRELDDLKNEFVSIVAHDLRSPMTVIVGFVDTILNRWDDLPDGQKRDLLGVVSRNTKRLAALVDDVLQVARMESGDQPYDIKPFDLGALVERTAAEMSSAQPDKPVSVTLPASLPPALGDEDRQWRVLTNLLSNAQKFSPAGTPVEVRVCVEGPALAVTVEDRGPGIPAELLPKLFGKFSRLGVAPGGEKGTGLGLYICKALVEAQGGTIDVTSAVGEGTTFRYTVPVA
jgi:signal transduction histidine kinase